MDLDRYLTNSFDYAYSYGECFATEENSIKKLRYFFVNSVPNPGKQQPYDIGDKNISFQEYLRNDSSIKMFNGSLKKPLKIEESLSDVYDSQYRKILKGSYQNVDQKSIALAHHNLVVPAYLIEIEEKTDVCDIVDETLYSVLKIKKITQKNAIFTINDENSANYENSEFSFNMIAEEFEKEIKAYHPKQIDYLISMWEDGISYSIEELSFSLNSALKLKIDEKRKFYTELLDENDDDYKFILRSFDKKNSENLPKIRQLFRISLSDENEVYNYKEKYLYLNGVKVKEVKDILSNGFPEEENARDDSDAIPFELTTDLDFAVSCGRNYFEVNNTVKDL